MTPLLHKACLSSTASDDHERELECAVVVAQLEYSIASSIDDKSGGDSGNDAGPAIPLRRLLRPAGKETSLLRSYPGGE